MNPMRSATTALLLVVVYLPYITVLYFISQQADTFVMAVNEVQVESTSTTTTDRTITSATATTKKIGDTIRVVPAAVLYQSRNDEVIFETEVSYNSFDEKLRIHDDDTSQLHNNHDDNKNTVHATVDSRTNYLHRQLQMMVTDVALTTTTSTAATAKSSLKLMVHPNAKASCYGTAIVVAASSAEALSSFLSSSSSFTTDKYQMEASFTEYFANHLHMIQTPMVDGDDSDSSDGTDDSNNGIDSLLWSDCWSSPQTTATTETFDESSDSKSNANTFYNYCDMGSNLTVIQKDYNQLIRVGGSTSSWRGTTSNNSTTASTTNTADDSTTTTLPCRFYTREGVRIVSLKHLETLIAERQRQIVGINDDLSTIVETTESSSSIEMDGSTSTTTTSTTTESPPTELTKETTIDLHIYAVPAGRVFMFAPHHVGETFTLSHIVLPKPPPNLGLEIVPPVVTTTAGGNNNIRGDLSIVSLEVLSVLPPIYDIHHFFSIDESNKLIAKALAEQSETYKFHRSTTGTSSSNIYSKRTSENAWDTHGATAQLIKRRCFQLLGFDEYQEEMTDGLQILRYNSSTAYVSHLDYLEDSGHEESYDYDTSKKGGNRFATILLYFTTLDEGGGGETVFPHVPPPGIAGVDLKSETEGLRMLRKSGDTKGILKDGSWEERMTASCRTRFSVRPKALRAVLFYSQFPNGTVDPLSYHGGCPVLRGSKLAANLWTWSAIRPEFDGAPMRDGAVVNNESDDDGDLDDELATTSTTILATFKNSGIDERFRKVELYYDEAGFFGKLGFDDSAITVNTYSGHVWNIKDEVTKVVLQTFIISDDKESQTFVV